MSECFVFLNSPSDFAPRAEAAGCYCEFEDKILILKRQAGKLQADTWCMPGGKLEKAESPREAVIREVREEVGIEIDEPGLKEVGRLYVRLPVADYIFYMFRKSFATCPAVNLDLKEHQEAKWVTVSEAFQFPLIPGGKEALQYYQESLHEI